MNGKLLTCVLALTLGIIPVAAQTDMTSYIKNPSFENEMTGWVHKSMGTQGNNVFSIKDGNTYVEKWTGRGGAVGSGSVSQELTGLPPGNYELTAVAQNIQEDTPTKAQTGAYIFAGSNKTTVTVRDTYTVAFNFVSGKITIGFEAKDASGNWIAVDNFRLTLVGQNLTEELNATIETATALFGDGSGKEAAQLLTAINAARDAVNNTEGDAQAQAIVALEKAIDIYRRANASEENPLDMTALITNPSFEKDGTTGWTSTNMGAQGNSVFSIKDGNTYVEKWTGRGSAVGDARISQTLTNMKPGRYLLKAAAQNIQEDTPKTAQTGAWIYANTHQAEVTVRQDYTLEFVLVSNQLEIGFKAEGATGNWLAVDNFRLLYTSDNVEDVKNEFNAIVAKAEALATQKTNAAAHNALQTAIDAAKSALQSSASTEAWSEAACNLEAAYHTAETSQDVFSRLKAAIDEAKAILADSQAGNASEYQAAIDAAQGTYDSAATTDAKAEVAILTLAEAGFTFRVANGSGTAPTVTTDPRFIRGATWAFGRSTVKGANIMEEGFCWSEEPDPKVTDHRTTEYLNQAGKIYWLRDLKPATVYYMRAYAITKDYAVGYGDVIKFVTVPKGTIGHWYNNGGDEETNDRINYAINTAIDYYWNNLSSIHGFGISVSYSPGTPTADCGYGGGMRVGASSSYQQVGTIMHEAFHGIGVGTHNNWWSGDYRTNGVWTGDRVTEAVRFWDNNTDGVISGDDMHLWPYGCNGAQEDTHSDNLYCMMGILAQALNEDGLPGSGEIGYALPYYAFNHEDGVKYYIKNENEARGLYTSYLVETADHKLQWTQMSSDEALANDAAAWYLTFTPSNQYYQLRNAATGYYITYASGAFRTVKHNTPTSADNLHLMRGRVDVTAGKSKFRGYYVIHPESSSNPPVLAANANGLTASSAFNIAKTATAQRWLILSTDDMEAFENGALNAVRSELAEIITQIRKLAETPHTEEMENADQKLAVELDDIEATSSSTNDKDEITSLVDRARKAGITFLESVAASNPEQPFDLTFMLQNPDFDTDATTGWTTNASPGYGGGGAEFYEKTFNFYQTLTNMPAGIYQFRVQAFQRPGETDAAYSKYVAGTSKITTSLYMGNVSAAVKHICDDSQPTALFNDGGWGSDKKLGDGTYVPNCMDGAARYFAKGLYDNSVDMENTTSGASIKVGLRCTSAPSVYWTMFDHFRLYFFGQNHSPVGIENAESEDQIGNSKAGNGKYYDLQGRQIGDRKSASRQIYIINGKKIIR